ncbi:MAG: NAD(P)-binding domain-containing protein [Gemmatimonadota bacterium]
MKVRVLNEAETRKLIGPRAAIAECREAFAKLARGEVEQPDVLTIEIPEHHGEVHGKGGYLHGAPFFSIKVATGFYENPKRGLPVTSGAVWVFDATTGLLRVMILDNGFLTELRTGAAGAIAADLLARADAATVGIVGAGTQARYQLEALLEVRAPTRVLVWSRNPARAAEYAAEMTERFGRNVEPVARAEDLVAQSDIVVTTTPADEPVVQAAWVRPGTHITAMGSDMAHKRELEASLLGGATVVADRLKQCLTQGEIHHAVAAGVLRADQVHAELGDVAAGLKPGRRSAAEITIADLTGVGVLDAAVANYVAARAEIEDVGRWIEA